MGKAPRKRNKQQPQQQNPEQQAPVWFVQIPVFVPFETDADGTSAELRLGFACRANAPSYIKATTAPYTEQWTSGYAPREETSSSSGDAGSSMDGTLEAHFANSSDDRAARHVAHLAHHHETRRAPEGAFASDNDGYYRPESASFALDDIVTRHAVNNDEEPGLPPSNVETGASGARLAPQPTRIRRPMNSFFLFRREQHERLQRASPGLSTTDISKLVARLWKELPPESRRVYRERAHQTMRMVIENNPGWRYSSSQGRASRASQSAAAVPEATHQAPAAVPESPSAYSHGSLQDVALYDDSLSDQGALSDNGTEPMLPDDASVHQYYENMLLWPS